MSRSYSMSVNIKDVDKQRIEQLKEAALNEWGFDEWCHPCAGCDELTGWGDGWLCGGESDDEFAQRLTLAIWRANGAFCSVYVVATYLEDLPYESYELDEDDYSRLMNAVDTP